MRCLSKRTCSFNVQLVADRKSTRLNSSHLVISYAVFCLKKKMPSQLLPDGWVCIRAAELFLASRALLYEPAQAHLSSAIRPRSNYYLPLSCPSGLILHPS